MAQAGKKLEEMKTVSLTYISPTDELVHSALDSEQLDAMFQRMNHEVVESVVTYGDWEARRESKGCQQKNP